MLKILFSFFLILVLNSCKINGNFKGLYSYYDSSKAKKPNLFVKTDFNTPICKLQPKELPQVHLINGLQLKSCLEKNDTTLVYIWTPQCKSKVCYPLNVIQEEAKKHNTELFIVAEYYDADLMDRSYTIEHPILGIDTKYYNSNLTTTYLTAFKKDLGCDDLKNQGRYILFCKGRIVKILDDIMNNWE